MKNILFVALTAFLVSCGSLNKTSEPITGTYDVSCGKCNFDMVGDACELAIEIDGKYYYVEGSGLHDHGDAHAEDGMCNVRRKAKVKGTIKNGAFVAESLELLPYEG